MSGPRAAASCYLVQARGYDEALGKERLWNVAFDLGPGSFGQLWNYIDPSTLDAVVFSHCHADHMADVISLHVHRHWGPARGNPPLRLFGPQGLLERIRGVDGVGEEEDYASDFTIVTLASRVAFTVGPLTITPAEGWHSVPSFGFRVEGPSEDRKGTSTLFYTGDTDRCQTIVDGARGVDVLLSEVGFTSDETVEGIHMDGIRAGGVATDASVGRMLLTHIQPWTDPAILLAEVRSMWDGPVDLVCAGQAYFF